MHTWMWVVLLALGLIKLPIAALMLWIPFRSDAALASYPAETPSADSSDGDDGGSKTLPGAGLGGRGPHPYPRAPLGRGPRRGPHGCPTGGQTGSDGRASPARVRTARLRRGGTRVGTRR
jgi:hypothetical protein